MATVNQLRDRIKRRLARTAFTNLDALIVDEMTHAQTEILEAEKWLPSFLKRSQSIVLNATHYAIQLGGILPAIQNTLPPGFIRLLPPDQEDTGLTYFKDGYHYPVPRYDSFVQLKQLHGDGLDHADYPGGYYWNGNQDGVLQVRPQTNAGVTYQLAYYGRDADTPSAPDANGNTKWTRLAGDYLMHTAGVEIATYLRDKDALNYFSSKRQEAYVRLQGQKTAIDQGDTELVMGD